MATLSIRTIKIATIACMILCSLTLVACGSSNMQASSGAEDTSQAQEATNPIADTTIRIGTMPTEDILPIWVAEAENIFEDQAIDAEVITFDSAQALSAAISAGEVDMAMVDIMRAVKLCEAGSPVVLEWVTLGTEAEQGRFGIMAAADMPYSTLKELAAYAESNQLAGGGVGVAANTVPEYVFDKLCEQEGIAKDAIPTQEVAGLPERYSLMASGSLAAAALPGSLLALGEANGLKVLAVDTVGENLSQSVMVATEAFAAEKQESVMAVAKAWDEAAAAIDVNPEAYVSLLAENANLNGAIAETYPIGTYPMALVDGNLAHPQRNLVDPVMAWMNEKGYSGKTISYNPATGIFTLE